ncbi:hypothetical protein [Yinghuangia seranimata]|uniref:hypothetical protein n=1 Tax=Yinghuangia seranimata TaxID=408067 RepID=UPI00248C3119|nr:hypothetical protein [Yinghuangia seranimata]MDI2127749.1 hypothetical protein [Yinghuangia seranimata]
MTARHEHDDPPARDTAPGADTDTTPVDTELLSAGLRAGVAHVTAAPDLYARVAEGARARRRRLRTGTAMAVAAACAIAVAGVADPLGWRADTPARTVAADPVGTQGPLPATAPMSAPRGTAVTECPVGHPQPASPGVTDGPMLPPHPGTVLLCVYNATHDPSQNPVNPTITGTVYTGADADRIAANINAVPTTAYTPTGGRCSMLAPRPVLFFRNAAGNEAVAVLDGDCYNMFTDGRVQAQLPQGQHGIGPWLPS